MARATYFIVSADAPLPTWDLAGYGLAAVTVQALGLTGVICAPSPFRSRFDTPEDLEEIYDLIEESTGLAVEIEDLWLPTLWFPESRDPPLLSVYRVALDLFRWAYRFREGEMTERDLTEGAEWKGAISFSREETTAFQIWAKNQIETARSQYPKDSGLELSYTEDDSPWRNPRAWEAGGDVSS